jgi:hypothetical protein
MHFSSLDKLTPNGPFLYESLHYPYFGVTADSSLEEKERKAQFCQVKMVWPRVHRFGGLCKNPLLQCKIVPPLS